MWVHVSKVAKEHRLPEEALGAFAMKDPTRYSVIIDTNGPKIEATRVEKLVEEFRSRSAGSAADHK